MATIKSEFEFVEEARSQLSDALIRRFGVREDDIMNDDGSVRSEGLWTVKSDGEGGWIKDELKRIHDWAALVIATNVHTDGKLVFRDDGSGADVGTEFNGYADTAISYNSIGAMPVSVAIDGVSYIGTNISHYGECNTAATEQVKEVTISGYKLLTGSKVYVKFTLNNTATDLQLNVSGTGAIPIYYRGAAIPARYLTQNKLYCFVFDGTNYELVGDVLDAVNLQPADAEPQKVGIPSVGSSYKYALEDHVHGIDVRLEESENAVLNLTAETNYTLTIANRTISFKTPIDTKYNYATGVTLPNDVIDNDKVPTSGIIRGVYGEKGIGWNKSRIYDGYVYYYNTNTWQANTSEQEGYVKSPNKAAYKVWSTKEAESNPDWISWDDLVVGRAKLLDWTGKNENQAFSPSTWNNGAGGSVVWGQQWYDTELAPDDPGKMAYFLTNNANATKAYLNTVIDGYSYAKGFRTLDKNNDYVLLAGGGTKELTDFLLAGSFVKITGDTMTGDLVMNTKIRFKSAAGDTVTKYITSTGTNDIRFSVDDKQPLILSDTAVRPSNAEGTVISLGTASQPWKGTYTTILNITSTTGGGHLNFNRAAANYITAPEGGSFAFVPNGNATSIAGATIRITDRHLLPGSDTSNRTKIGLEDNPFGNAYLTNVYADYIYGSNIYARFSADTSQVIYHGFKNTSGDTIAALGYHNTAQKLYLNPIYNEISNVYEDALGKYSLAIGKNHLTYNTYPILHSGNFSSYVTQEYVNNLNITAVDLKAYVMGAGSLLGKHMFPRVAFYYTSGGVGLTDIPTWTDQANGFGMMTMPSADAYYMQLLSSSNNTLSWRRKQLSDQTEGGWKLLLDSETFKTYVTKAYIDGLNVNADTLDGVHASGLFTNLSNDSNQLSITIGGTNKKLEVAYAKSADTANFTHNKKIYANLKHTKSDNKGWPVYVCIADVTEIWNASSGATHKGFVGIVMHERHSGYSIGNTAFLNCKIGYDKDNYSLNCTASEIVPCVIQNGSKYYLALTLKGSGHDYYFYGYALDLLNPWIEVLTTDSTGTLPSGYSVVKTGGPTSLWAQVSKAMSADKLTTARKLWGLTFDGTADVSGNIIGAAGGVNIEFTNEINCYNGHLYLNHRGNGSGYNGGTTGNILALCNGGNFGIGTASPAYKLDVNGAMRVSGLITGTAGANFYGARVRIGCNNPDGTSYPLHHRLDMGYHSDDYLRIYEVNVDMYINGGTTQYAHISAGDSYFNGTGNVGIGTTSPSYKLHVAGDILSNGWLRTSGNTGWYSNTHGGGWYMVDGTYVRSYNNKCVYLGGGARMPSSPCISQEQADTSLYAVTIKWLKNGTGWYKDNTTLYTRQPQIGLHNTGDTYGSIVLLPYATDTNPWDSAVGLYISKTRLKYENNTVIHSGNITNYYWANVHISASSNSATTPTFASMTATSSATIANIKIHNTDEINRFSGNLYLQHRGNETTATGNIIALKNGGLMGIGTSSPVTKLHIEGGNLRVSSSNSGAGGDVYTELWRGTNASWKILNNGGTLKFQSNYTTAVTTYFDAMTLAYNTGNMWVKGTVSSAGYIHRGISSDNYVITANGGYKAWGNAANNLAVNNGTLCTNLNADLWDGYHILRNANPDSQTSWSGMIPWWIALKGAGYPVYNDPEFASGNNSCDVYNNSGNGTVTITRQADDQNSRNSSGYILKISTTGGTASPGRGGFVQHMQSANNKTFVQIFRAKIPSGFSVVNAENPMGTGYKTFWLTTTAGTGKWEWYVRVTQCGVGGTLSGGGHVYLNGTGAVTWYLSYCNCIELSNASYDGLRTKYANDADKLDGLHAHGGRNNEANKVVRTDSNGYIQAGWINTTSGDMGTTSADRVYCSNDTYIRYKTITNFGKLLRDSGSLDGRYVLKSGDTMTGTLHMKPTTSNYTEGIRFYGTAKDSTWSNVHFGCDPAATVGTHTNQWILGRNASNQFVIDKGSSANTTFCINTDKNIGIGTGAPSYKLHVASDILANGWLRTTGNNGWYSNSYGGGWYMIDSTWIRTYGSKNIYMNTGYIRTDYNNSGSWWISKDPRGKFVCQHGGTTTGWSPAFSFKSYAGKYELGSLNNTLYLNYYADTRTSNGIDKTIFEYTGGGTPQWNGNALTANTATSATKATQDSDGNTIKSTYLKLSGGTMTGTINAKNIVVPSGYYIYGVDELGGAMVFYDASTKRNIFGSKGASTTGALHFRSPTGHATISSDNNATYTVLDSGNYINYISGNGSATVGNEVTPVYLSSGTLKACNSMEDISYTSLTGVNKLDARYSTMLVNANANGTLAFGTNSTTKGSKIGKNFTIIIQATEGARTITIPANITLNGSSRTVINLTGISTISLAQNARVEINMLFVETIYLRWC